jgi:MtfA peptidase
MEEVPMLWVTVACVLLVAGLLLQPRWREWRRERWRRQPFPKSWRKTLRRRVPMVARLPADRQLQLKNLMKVFLAEVPFIPCAGLRLRTEMRVVVAAQACMLLLGRSEPGFAALRQVLIYPGAFVVPRTHQEASGVQHHERQVLVGESWTLGQVLLSWEDVLRDAADPSRGRNVVFHEFAHQLDQAKGAANGLLPLDSEVARHTWAEVMQAEYDALQRRVAQGHSDLLPPYAATDPAEFLAVASEFFFSEPMALAAAHPDLYQQLTAGYRLDPRLWAEATPAMPTMPAPAP